MFVINIKGLAGACKSDITASTTDVCIWMIAVHELNVYVHTYIDECTLFRHLLF